MSKQEKAVASARQIWVPLINEINSLMDALCVLDNDKTNCVDILAKHVERIQNTIPTKPVHMWYPKPMHKLLSVQPLTRIEIPLDVLDILVSSGFDVDEYYNDGSSHYSYSEHNEKKVTCLHLAVKNHHYNAARWLVKHGADCNKYSYEKSLSSYSFPDITPITLLARHRNAPLDLFNQLNTTKSLNSSLNLPLHVAAKYGHTDIALHLIELGAKVNYMSSGSPSLHIAAKHDRTELALLLIKHGAPVKQKDRFGDLPLHIAVKNGHTELALSLIKHGASFSHTANGSDLAFSLIKFYINKVRNNADHFHNEIFTKLIPGRSMDILRTICEIFGEKKIKLEILPNMLHKLIQHLILAESLSITIRSSWGYSSWDYSFEMKLNIDFIFQGRPMKTLYFCSVLVILLRCNISVVNAMVPPSSADSGISTESLLQAHATVDLLNAYKKQQTVRKLQTLCIHKTRQSMNSLSDESFQSLSVPSSIQKMLMLQDIADVLFEGYEMWPKRLSIEELMSLGNYCPLHSQVSG